MHPIGNEAIKARKELWGAGRRSMNLGVVITILIFLSVPPVYLLRHVHPAVHRRSPDRAARDLRRWRAIGPGGEVKSGFDRMGEAMKPLGLELTDRPSLRMVPRAPTMPGYSATLVGPTAMSGERHGHKVEVHQEAGMSEVTVHVNSPKFEAKAKRGRFSADERRLGRGRLPLRPARIGSLERRQDRVRPHRRDGRSQGRSERLALRSLAGGADRRAELGRAGGGRPEEPFPFGSARRSLSYYPAMYP